MLEVQGTAYPEYLARSQNGFDSDEGHRLPSSGIVEAAAVVGFAEGFTVGFCVGAFVGDGVGFAGEGVVTIISPPWLPWGKSILTLKTPPDAMVLPAAPPLFSLFTELIRSRCTRELLLLLLSEPEAIPRRAAEVVEAIVMSRKTVLIEAFMECILRCCFDSLPFGSMGLFSTVA